MAHGKVLDYREREFIVRLKAFFDKERCRTQISTKDAVGRVAEAMEVSVRTVKDVLAFYHRNGHVGHPDLTHRGKRSYRFPESLETAIRQQIRERNREGKHVSLAVLREWLEQEKQEIIPQATLARALQRMGFVHGHSHTKSRLRERDEVIIARRKYLRDKRANRDTTTGGTLRPEVYLDESYVNVNHSSSATWYTDDEGPLVEKPSGKGRRLIIVNAITDSGWVNGAKLVFEAKKRTGDYHGQMNYGNFKKWFVTQLLPNIPNSSLIVHGQRSLSQCGTRRRFLSHDGPSKTGSR